MAFRRFRQGRKKDIEWPRAAKILPHLSLSRALVLLRGAAMIQDAGCVKLKLAYCAVTVGLVRTAGIFMRQKVANKQQRLGPSNPSRSSRSFSVVFILVPL